MMLPLASVPFIMKVAAFVWVFVTLCLILLILIQKGRGGGLSGAFGGAGGGASLLGTKTGDFLTWVTISLVAAFLVLAVLMGKFMRPSGTSSTLSGPDAPLTAPITDVEPVDAEADTTAPVDETVDAVVDEVESTPEPAAAEVTTETTE